MKILMIATLILDLIALLLIVVEDITLFKSEKYFYALLTLFVPILGALIVMYKFGGKGKSPSNSDGGYSVDYPPSHLSGGDSGGGGD